jgi:hypothetical protein
LAIDITSNLVRPALFELANRNCNWCILTRNGISSIEFQLNFEPNKSWLAAASSPDLAELQTRGAQLQPWGRCSAESDLSYGANRPLHHEFEMMKQTPRASDERSRQVAVSNICGATRAYVCWWDWPSASIACTVDTRLAATPDRVVVLGENLQRGRDT